MARLLVPLVAILLVSRAYGAQVKITADGEAQERVAALQLIDDECAEQAVTLEHECDTCVLPRGADTATRSEPFPLILPRLCFIRIWLSVFGI